MSTEDTKPMTIEELLYEMVMPLVDDPEEITIEFLGNENSTLKFRVRVADDDVGSIIGRKGATIRAIEEYLRRVAARDRNSVNVTVHNPREG